MTKKTTLTNRLLSLLLCFALILAYVPATELFSIAADLDGNRVVDPSTMDAWKDFLLPADGSLSTENAGGIWTNKSVFTNANAFAGTGITMDKTNSFLVALSAIASNKTVTGMSQVPTDTMLVLDVSASMNSSNSDVAEELVLAANQTIKSLLDMNDSNRVGVVLYSGNTETNGPAPESTAMVLLPLGRYTTETVDTVREWDAANREYVTTYISQYLTYTTGDGEFVGVDSTVLDTGTGAAPSTINDSKQFVGGTYIQRGIKLALDQFMTYGTALEDPALSNVKRTPIMVLMSDGATTLGNTNFMDPTDVITSEESSAYPDDPYIGDGYDLGSGNGTSADVAFVTQLSAAYAKQQIEKKYGGSCLFYTLGLGSVNNDAIGLSVLDPANSTTAINTFWENYNAAALTAGSYLAVKAAVTDEEWVDTDNRPSRPGYGEGYWQTVTVEPARSVVKVDGLSKNYVTKYFSVTGSGSSLASGLTGAFQDIVAQISLQSKYFPTLISDSEDLSGYISFVDRIGQYMEVVDVKGILINNTLFSGADLASNFVASGSGLGTAENPTDLGNELVWAVMKRIGLQSADEARTLIDLAYRYGQLSYTSNTEYSNYIGWYANAAGQFLGFWHEGITTMPDPADPSLTDATRPTFIMKSYGYLGEVDEAEGVAKSDMMYATVQVRESITTGEQTVILAIPAALIPTITYQVTLDRNGDLENLTASGATNPIRLVYEVALDDSIDEFNLKNKVSADYLAANTNADGSVNFYTNQYEADNSTGYNKVNTYSYFNPSRQNDRYYYLENTPIYADANGTLYEGSAKPTGTMYRKHTVYRKVGNTLQTHVGYHPLTADALAIAVKQENTNHWYIPRGTVRGDYANYTMYKGELSSYDAAQNPTGTLQYANQPFVDTSEHGMNDEGYDYIVGATLGNNGRISIQPATGIRIEKAYEGTSADSFRFTLSAAELTGNFEARHIAASGIVRQTQLRFVAGKAEVELKQDEAMEIIGLPAGTDITVTEEITADHVLTQINGNAATGNSHTLRTEAGSIQTVRFTNAARGKGNLTVAKEVEHDFGTDYQIPADKVFTLQVTLQGIGTANHTFAAKQTGSSITGVTTDANGRFTVQLKDNEQLELFDLPEGTVATVRELEPGTGFTPAYWDSGVLGDGQVTVAANATVSVIVVNDYTANRVYPVNLTVSGTKLLSGREWAGTDVFTFELQKHMGGDQWQSMGTATVSGSDADKEFDFNGAFASESYTAAGSYYYRVVELEPASGALGGVTYDKTVHSFSVDVADADMDGQLEISAVSAYRPETTHVTQPTADSWHVTVDFNNHYAASGFATANIDLNKLVENPSGSPLALLSGFTFGLFENGATEPSFVSNPTTDRGFARMVLSYTAAGTYTYTLKEIVPATAAAGWTYSNVELPVTVVVEDTGSGSLRALIYTGQQQPADASNAISASFTNRYVPGFAELEIDFVSKLLSGRPLKANEFSFEVRDTEGKTLLTGTNDAAGKVSFDGKLKFEQVGVYFRDIVETTVDGNGVTVDKNTYRITITVSDNAGQLQASYVLVNAEGDQIVFRNSYTAAEVGNVIAGNKTLNGRVLINEEFSFRMTEALDAYGTVAEGAKSYNAKNFSDGSFRFPEIRYTAAGTYYYTVAEVKNGLAAYGIRYDETVYVVTVQITDNGLGQLVVSSVSYAVQNGGAADSIHFTNEYIPNPTSAAIPGNKVLQGKVLGAGDFSFELYASNAAWESGELLETVKNAAGGSFGFASIRYEKSGVHYYLVKEANGGQTINGVTYDATVYRVRVEVTDDLRGQLHAAVVIVDQDNIPHDAIEFVNIYRILGDASVTLTGEKTLNGREMENGEFSFELFQANESFAIQGAAIQTAVNEGSSIRFALDYTEADAGKTFYYVVKEVNGGQKINGVTYSDVQYQIAVTVADDGVGGIMTSTVIRLGEETVQSLDFVNSYAPDPTSVSFSGTKTLSGRELLANEFSFDIYNANAAFMIHGAALRSVRNAADGSFSFANLPLTEAKTYYFVVKENAHAPLSGVTYDQAEYHITVVVSDDGQGKLAVIDSSILRVVGRNSAAAQSLDFANSYDPLNATLSLGGSKELLGRDLISGEFTFLLQETDESFVAKPDALLHQTVNEADGSFVFDALTFRSAGIYYFTVSEDTTVSAARVSFDKTVYHVTVTVTDNGSGRLTAAASITKQGQRVQRMEFVNVYTPKPTELGFSGSKVLNGRPLASNEFSFALYRANSSFAPQGAALQTVQNAADGSFSFSDVTMQAAGKYYFLVKENAENPLPGVRYDGAVYQITVTVGTDAHGDLYVASTAMQKLVGQTAEAANAIRFTNSYVAESTHIGFSGEKILTGRELMENAFTFELFRADESFAIQGAALASAKNAANGSFRFADVMLNEAGSYYFVVKENSQVPMGGVIYDQAEYHITVRVADDGQGKLYVAAQDMLCVDGAVRQPAELIRFENSYIADAATVILQGTKHLEGRKLVAGEFTFLLQAADENFTALDVAPRKALNQANGSFTFDALTFRQAGTYYFTVTEDASVDAARVTFDESVYQVTVTVTDDGSGKLTAKTAVTKQGAAAEQILFTNTFTPRPEDISVEILVEKTVVNQGREEIGPEGFRFELLNTLTGQKQIAVSDAKGAAAFGLKFTEEDVGKTHIYKLTELNEGAANVEYSDAVYMVEITVSLGEDNRLAAKILLNGEATDKPVAAFENKYNYTVKAPDLPVQLLVNKTVVNVSDEQISPEGFRFLLENLLTGEKVTAISDKDGKTGFSLVLTDADIGKTLSYKLTEINDGAEAVIYSQAEYLVEIAVGLSEDNKLLADIRVNGVQTEAVVVEFVNVYDSTILDPPDVPDFGDHSDLSMWLALLFVSGGCFVATAIFSRKKEENT